MGWEENKKSKKNTSDSLDLKFNFKDTLEYKLTLDIFDKILVIVILLNHHIDQKRVLYVVKMKGYISVEKMVREVWYLTQKKINKNRSDDNLFVEKSTLVSHKIKLKISTNTQTISKYVCMIGIYYTLCNNGGCVYKEEGGVMQM